MPDRDLDEIVKERIEKALEPLTEQVASLTERVARLEGGVEVIQIPTGPVSREKEIVALRAALARAEANR